MLQIQEFNMDNRPILSQPGSGGDQGSILRTNYSDWTPSNDTDPPQDGGNGVTIRTMTTADADFAARCVIIGFQAKIEKHIPRDKVEPCIGLTSQIMSRLQPDAQSNFMVAEYSGKPAGIALIKFNNQSEYDLGGASIPYCSVLGCCNVIRLSRFAWWQPGTPDNYLQLETLAVMDGFRGKGIGKALLNAVDQRARDMKLEAVCLWCAYENPALRLYKRHGYIEERFMTGNCRATCSTGVDKWHYVVKRL